MRRRRSGILSLVVVLLSVTALLSACSVGPTRVVHCDHCGKEIAIAESSNITEDWILFCEECAVDLEPVIE